MESAGGCPLCPQAPAPTDPQVKPPSAAAVLAAVLIAQPFLHAGPSLFDWARITTAIWALLYVLLSVDPTIRDKIAAARDLADLIQTAPSSPSSVIQEQRKTP
jgi:hypothetical protein